MPSTYAHYRFGQLGFSALPENIRLSVQRFRQLYDVGLHGPDLFFFYQPMFHTKLGELGGRTHALTGREFFEAAVARLHQEPSEGATAYLFGVLGHFALDSTCHPLIRSIAGEGRIGHTELETEFDRYLLSRNGEESPHTRNTGKHIRLTWGECVTVAQFYPPASAYAIRRSVRIMSLTHWALAWKNRDLASRIFSLGGRYAREMVMYPRPNHRCSHLNGELGALFDEALDRFPHMAEELAALIRDGKALGEDFDRCFG